MVLVILRLVHVVFGAVGICAGAWVLFGILEGKLFKKWAGVFLNCALVASATGLLFLSHHFPTHWAAMCAVYVSGVAVLAWRRYGLAGIWALIFAWSSMLVLCLEILVVIAHGFHILNPTYPNQLFLTTESMVIALFIGFCIFTVKKYRDSQTRPKIRLQVHGCN